MKLVYRAELIAEGIYPAEIIAVEEQPTENGTALRIVAKVRNEDSVYNGIAVSTLVTPMAAGRTRLSKYYEQVVGTALLGGEEIDTDQMVGKLVMITVKLKKGKDGEIHPDIAEITAR